MPKVWSRNVWKFLKRKWKCGSRSTLDALHTYVRFWGIIPSRYTLNVLHVCEGIPRYTERTSKWIITWALNCWSFWRRILSKCMGKVGDKTYVCSRRGEEGGWAWAEAVDWTYSNKLMNYALISLTTASISFQSLRPFLPKQESCTLYSSPTSASLEFDSHFNPSHHHFLPNPFLGKLKNFLIVSTSQEKQRIPAVVSINFILQTNVLTFKYETVFHEFECKSSSIP